MEENKIRTNIINAEKYRKDMMLNVFAGKPLYGVEDEYAFFYDETNNIRKFWIRDDGLNTNPKNFILGGIAYKKNNIPNNLNNLFEILNIQKSAKEIKFKQLATGTYLGVLNSRKVGTLLEWMIDNEVFIHYTNFNVLYWSLVDIVDSLWNDPHLGIYMEYVMHIKSELYFIVKSGLDIFVPLLRKYRYPNIQKKLGFEFMNEFADAIELISKNFRSDISDLVVFMIRKGAYLPELKFITDNEDDILINDFNHLFRRPLSLYPNSSHTFDNETEVQEKFGNLQVEYQGKFVEYSFVDSQDIIEIQLSDGISGLLGSHFNFLEDTSFSDLVKFKKNLNPNQRKTLSLLRKIIDISDKQSNGFLHRITPMYSDIKNDFFLYDIPFPTHVARLR